MKTDRMSFLACFLLFCSTFLFAQSPPAPRVDQLLSMKGSRAETSVFCQRTYLRVRDGARFRSLTLVDPAKPRTGANTVDIEIGTRNSQALYVQATMAEQASYTDPPAREVAPADVEALRSAIGAADRSILTCDRARCDQYCQSNGKWRCCRYSC